MALSDGQIAYYKFDGNVNDATGNGNNGTVMGATLTTGKINQGYNFDGINDKITLFSNISSITTISVGMWVKFTDFTTLKEHYLMSIGYNNNSSFLFSQDNRSALDGLVLIKVSSSGTATRFITSPSYFPTDNDWHHIVLTIDNTIGLIYIDGVVKISSALLGSGSVTGLVELGFSTGRNKAGTYFKGDMDEVGIWDRILSQAEVTELFNSDVGLQYPYSPAQAKSFALLFASDF